MDRLVKKYAHKLICAGLASAEYDHLPLVGGLDDELVWSRQGPEVNILEDVFAGLNINSLVFLTPAEPYRTIINFLARNGVDKIEPKDCETRTFLHELPVTHEFTAKSIINVLKKKKSVIVASDDGCPFSSAVIAHGTVSPEQGFGVVSSVCFACFVKFFIDYLEALQTKKVTAAYHDAFNQAVAHTNPLKGDGAGLIAAPLTHESLIYKAISEAGKKIVDYHLVDSYFGNISYCWNDTLYISQTGSSLDELEGCIDPVPMDGSTSAGLTASSELSAHLNVIARTGCRSILHGHPKFSVIMSMDCPPEDKDQCEFTDQCHTKCPKQRFVGNVPIVPGEVGTGPTGLCHTLPLALETQNRAIVYGHGLFTTGQYDFNEPFQAMVTVENMCRKLYFEKIHALR